MRLVLVVAGFGLIVPALCSQDPLPAFLPKVERVDTVTFQAHDSYVLGMLFAHDQKKWMATYGINRGAIRELFVWDRETKKRLQTFEEGSATAQFLSGNQGILTYFRRRDGWEILRCDLETRGVTVLYRSTESAWPVSLWSDRKVIVVLTESAGNLGGRHVVKFVDYQDKKEVRFAQPEPFTVLGFSPDRKLLALRYGDAKIRVFDWAGNKKLSEFTTAEKKDENEKIEPWLFCSDNKFAFAVVTGLTSRIEKWDLVQGKRIQSVETLAPLGWPTALTSDDRFLVIAEGRLLWFVDSKTGKIAALRGMKEDGPGFRATAIAIAPDGQSVAVGGSDGKVRILPMPKLGK